MPLGNGQVGINLWVEEDGDLRFYISRTDSLSEISRLLKVGGVRISLDPNPFKAGTRSGRNCDSRRSLRDHRRQRERQGHTDDFVIPVPGDSRRR